ncbi:MAG: RNA polymerase sigma factor SigX [Candidatus Methylacidiphilales bacterium]
MEAENLPEEVLVAQAQAELPYHSSAYEALMARYAGAIRAHCLRMCRNLHDAEDLTQEILVKIYFQLTKFRGESGFRTWLWRLVSNHCVDHLRRQVSRPILVDAEELLEKDDEGQEARRATQKVEAQDLLLRLSDDERQILLLRLQIGLEFQEIADALGIGLSAAKMRYTRSVEKLKGLAEQ